jgi:ABC-type branched-subunit amino acid transport system ATPase component
MTTIATAATPERADPGQAVLNAHGLDKRFGGLQAIADVDVTLRAGTVLGVIGPNGAGKSTLVNLLTGMYRPDRGEVLLQGRDISREDMPTRARRGLLRTFQHTKVLRSFTVAQALDLACRSPRGRSGDRRSRVAAVAADFGLERVLGRRVLELPYGTQKVLNLGLVALAEPVAVLLDEPFAGVTAADVGRLSRVVERLRAAGTAIALVEHDMRALMALSTTVLVLDSGKVVTEGTPAAIQDDPEVRRIYLGQRREGRQ